MANGIRFYAVIWQRPDNTFTTTTEAAKTRRYLSDQIKSGALSYEDEDGRAWRVIKVQEIETPMIDVAWLLHLFTTAGTKKTREERADQAAYVLRLVESCAARVMLETGEVIER